MHSLAACCAALLTQPQSRSQHHSLTLRYTISPTLFSYLIHSLAARTLLRPDIQSHPPSSLTSSTISQPAVPLSYAQTYSLTHPLLLPHPQSCSQHHSLTPRHTVSPTLFSYLIHHLAVSTTLLRPDIQYHPPSFLTSSTVSQPAHSSSSRTASAAGSSNFGPSGVVLQHE